MQREAGPAAALPVLAIPDDRPPGERGMDPDLVRAAGVQLELDRRHAGAAAEQPYVGLRGLALDRPVPRARDDLALEHRAVGPPDRVLAKRPGDPLVRGLGERDQHQARGW